MVDISYARLFQVFKPPSNTISPSPLSTQNQLLKPSLQGLIFVSEVEVGGATPKRRTVRKFAVRGVDMDQLLDMGTNELVKLFFARAHRYVSNEV
ncbi:hypothetical protein IFM89_013200 [Coptis chinensis]|uniref:Uncharacterized protein n=1 Tax=Coptis chinensis TaxID=261450 RepID=A0A835LVQ8_9MAGN|nr:hypothetical protein IFM89_013200 [Coptis chinensis]